MTTIKYETTGTLTVCPCCGTRASSVFWACRECYDRLQNEPEFIEIYSRWAQQRDAGLHGLPEEGRAWFAKRGEERRMMAERALAVPSMDTSRPAECVHASDDSQCLCWGVRVTVDSDSGREQWVTVGGGVACCWQLAYNAAVDFRRANYNVSYRVQKHGPIANKVIAACHTVERLVEEPTEGHHHSSAPNTYPCLMTFCDVRLSSPRICSGRCQEFNDRYMAILKRFNNYVDGLTWPCPAELASEPRGDRNSWRLHAERRMESELQALKAEFYALRFVPPEGCAPTYDVVDRDEVIPQG
jgi:hypothetical protein